MTVLVGTSGWSYADWRGRVFPRGLDAADELAHYARQLPTVEINSTYYRDPPPSTVHGWLRKVEAAPEFEFAVKAPQSLTHEAMVDGSPEECARAARWWRSSVTRPLEEAGRLGAILLQLSPGVLASAQSLERLEATLAALAGVDIAVEFRNRSWLAGDALRADAVEVLDAHGAAPVVVDGPPFPTVIAGRAPHAYVRFHGRNDDVWFRARKVEDDPDDPRANRYDYRYSADELAPWVPRVADLAARAPRVRVFFNNHYEGKAFQNARELVGMLARAGVHVPPSVEPGLDAFG